MVYKSVCALRSLAELGLIQKPVLKELVSSVLPLLSHPVSNPDLDLYNFFQTFPISNNYCRSGLVELVAL